jgi:hypothetical protein
MANNCDTTYKIVGSKRAIDNLWHTLSETFEGNGHDIRLYKLAEHYGIDYEQRCISVRGHIYYIERDCQDVITICTDTAWTGCHDLFYAINEVLDDELSISYMEIEPGMEIFCVHDEDGFFGEECILYADGEIFDYQCGDLFDTIECAINFWCERMGKERDMSLSQKQYLDMINKYEYDDADTYFNLYTFTYE